MGEGVEASGRQVRGIWRMDFPDLAPEQVFALAADIQSYPRFVPWCIATRVLARQPDHWWCDNVFGAGPLRLRFHTRAEFTPPQAIDITSQDGPFRSFHLFWRFTPQGHGTLVEAGFTAVFHHEVARLAARLSLAEVERRILAAFRRRAELLYD